MQPPTTIKDRFWGTATRIDVLTSLGTFVVSTGLLTWVAQRWSELTGGSWPASIFIGLGASCALVLAVSVYMAAFRYFKPLPPQAADRDPDPTGPVVIDPKDIVPHHETWQGRAENSFRNLDRSVFLLIANAMELHGVHVLEQAIENLPPAVGNEESDEALGEETILLNKYERTTADHLNGTYWFDGFRRAVGAVEMQAEGDLKRRSAIPPDGIDAYVFRDYYIAKMKRNAIERFLNQTLAEAKSHRRQMFGMLRDQRGLHGKP